MDILSALAEGKRGAVARSDAVAHYTLDNPEALSLLIDTLRFEDETVVSHAAHACLTIFTRQPDVLLPYRIQLQELLMERDQWEIIEQLSKIVPHLGCSSQEGAALSARFLAIVEKGKSSIARTCALQALVDLSMRNAVYGDAAKKALQYALQHGTKAMQARARKLMG